MGVGAPQFSRGAVSVAGWVRFFFRAITAGVVTGVLAGPFLGVFGGTDIEMVTLPDPLVVAEGIVAEQQRLGLDCQKEPVLTDVVVFQRIVRTAEAMPVIEVLTFDEALAASQAKTGWVLWYCA